MLTHRLNAFFSIPIKLLGRFKLPVRPVQLENAVSGIVVIALEPKLSELILVQLEKELIPIEFILLPNVKEP
jgi:hypothetical protein